MIAAALSHLEEAKIRDSEDVAVFYEDLTGHYRQRQVALSINDADQEVAIAESNRFRDLSLEALRVERETALRLRNEGRINDEVLRRIERELDLNESRLATND